jgi:hypothetical protein
LPFLKTPHSARTVTVPPVLFLMERGCIVASHVEREVDKRSGVIGPGARHPRSDHVAVADGLDLLEIVFLDQAVEALKYLVEEID